VRPTHETTEYPFSIAGYYSLILIDRDSLTLSHSRTMESIPTSTSTSTPTPTPTTPLEPEITLEDDASKPLRLLDADGHDSQRVYTLGYRMPFDEDQQHEFKALHQHVDKPSRRIVEYAARYINAFLNTVGGMLFCGVDVRWRCKRLYWRRREIERVVRGI